MQQATWQENKEYLNKSHREPTFIENEYTFIVPFTNAEKSNFRIFLYTGAISSIFTGFLFRRMDL